MLDDWDRQTRKCWLQVKGPTWRFRGTPRADELSPAAQISRTVRHYDCGGHQRVTSCSRLHPSSLRGGSQVVVGPPPHCPRSGRPLTGAQIEAEVRQMIAVADGLWLLDPSVDLHQALQGLCRPSHPKMGRRSTCATAHSPDRPTDLSPASPSRRHSTAAIEMRYRTET